MDPTSPLRATVEEEVHFLNLAAAMLNLKASDADEKDAVRRLRMQFGSGIASIKKLAAVLRQTAEKEHADTINKVAAKAKATTLDGKSGTVASALKGGSVFS